jgi:hypothetical protein
MAFYISGLLFGVTNKRLVTSFFVQVTLPFPFQKKTTKSVELTLYFHSSQSENKYVISFSINEERCDVIK